MALYYCLINDRLFVLLVKPLRGNMHLTAFCYRLIDARLFAPLVRRVTHHQLDPNRGLNGMFLARKHPTSSLQYCNPHLQSIN